MGEVLAVNDPEAWANTLAFSGRTPSQAEVDAHLAKLKAEGVEITDTPVHWAFGVMWETEVSPYAEVFKAWKQARREAYAKIPRKQGQRDDRRTVPG
jgi:hypothetical protein